MNKKILDRENTRRCPTGDQYQPTGTALISADCTIKAASSPELHQCARSRSPFHHPVQFSNSQAQAFRVTSPRLRGEVGDGALAKSPGEGDSLHARSADKAPHPNPLPVRTGRGRRKRHAPTFPQRSLVREDLPDWTTPRDVAQDATDLPVGQISSATIRTACRDSCHRSAQAKSAFARPGAA